VVTNQTGVRVFAAAYDPYGGIQKIWENSYSPELKFSGKERDSESNLDYFGARYYANYYYRWLSPDPVVNRDEAMRNPQLWNLYSFCRNNPATYWDPDGMVDVEFTKFQFHYESSQTIRELSNKYTKGLGMTSGGFVLPDIYDNRVIEKRDKGWGISVKMKIGFDIYIPKEGDEIYRMKGVTGLPTSPQEAIEHELGHVYIDLFYTSIIYAEAAAIEGINFPSKYLAQAARYAVKTRANYILFGPNLMANFLYDFFGIKFFSVGKAE
jgi:RHS repeat-associated protein